MEITLSSKGQIVIPLQIRQNHGWMPGFRFSISDEDGKIVLKPSGAKHKSVLKDVIGCAGYVGPKKCLADMDAGILEEAQKQADSFATFDARLRSRSRKMNMQPPIMLL